MISSLTYLAHFRSFLPTHSGVFVSATFCYEGAFEVEPMPRNHLEDALSRACRFQLHKLLCQIGDEKSSTDCRPQHQHSSILKGLTQELRNSYNEEGLNLRLHAAVNSILHPNKANSIHERRILWKKLEGRRLFTRVLFTNKVLKKVKLLRLNSRRLEHCKSLVMRQLKKHT